jgi:uncharacterized protein involved in exopolysaccharide biosynthesis
MEEIQNNPIDPLKVLWSEKWTLLLFTLVVTGTSFFVSSYIPKQYQVKATVLVSPPHFNVENQEVGSLSIGFYRDLAMTSGVLQGVIDRLIPKYPNIKSSLYPTKLEKMITIDWGPEEFRVGAPRSAVMNFKVTGQRDPILLRDIANTLTDLLSEESRKMRANEIAAIFRGTEAIYISTKDALDKAEQALLKARTNNHLDSSLEHLIVKQINLRSFRAKLTKINVKLTGEESKLSSLMSESKKYPDNSIEDLMNVQVNSKSLTAKQNFLLKSITQLEKEISQLENKVLQIKLQEKQLKRAVVTLRSSFKSLSRRLEGIKVSESEKTSDMRLISKAIEPRFPVWPDRFKIVLITLVLSLVVGMTFFLGKEHLNNILK